MRCGSLSRQQPCRQRATVKKDHPGRRMPPGMALFSCCEGGASARYDGTAAEHQNRGMEMRRKWQIWKYIAWVPALLWYQVIWGFSAQPAAVSGGVSDGLLERLLTAASPAYAGAAPDVQIAAVEILSFFERKAAHMFLYFVLFLFLLLATGLIFLKIRSEIAAAGLVCLLLAGLDEYHQTFVPGRSGELRDVAVDMAGALCALGMWLLLRHIGEIRAGRHRVPCLSAAITPAAVGMLAVVAAPPMMAADGMAADFCARFWEAWPALTGAEQGAALSALSPIVGEILQIGLSGVLGRAAAERYPLRTAPSRCRTAATAGGRCG